jgi:Tfp pilus assembly protein PilV
MDRLNAAIGLQSRRGPRRSPARQRGVTLVESIGALFVAGIMLVGLSMLIDTSMKNIRDQQAAQYQSQVATGATQLVQANYATLASSATATTPAVVPFNSTAGLHLSTYLPPNLSA